VEAIAVTQAEPAQISVIIPVRNAAPFLDRCLDLIFQQVIDRPFEVVVAVGPSDDATEAIVAQRAAAEPRLRGVANPSGNTPTGLNLAIAECVGDLVVRVDAQSEIPDGYLQRLAATASRTGAANVGGRQQAVGFDPWSVAIAAAMTSPWGAGPAAFRRSTHEGPVDTVYLGAYDRASLDAVGGFNEAFLRNQDYELNWRLRQAGYTVWFDPELLVTYRPRNSLRALARQYFDYGQWKRRMVWAEPRSLRPRQVAAPLLVVGLAASLVTLPWLAWWSLVGPVAYLMAVAAVSLPVSATTRETTDHPAGQSARVGPASTLRRWPKVAMAIATMHLSWGCGFWLSLGS
jgi:succinoglycan biosynthesis protein ExoA